MYLNRYLIPICTFMLSRIKDIDIEICNKSKLISLSRHRKQENNKKKRKKRESSFLVLVRFR